MVWGWILGSLVCFVVAVALVRVGIVLDYDQSLQLRIKVGVWCFALGGKPKKKKPKQTKKKKKKKEPKQEKAKIDIAMILDGVRTLLPPVCKALVRTCKGIRLHPLTLSYVIGGEEDPAESAKQYGQCSALVWSVMPVLERLIDIPQPSIHMDVDFQQPQDIITAHVGITARVGCLVAVLFSLLIPGITWYTEYTKQHKPTEKTTA